jgi:hypothetical protein
MGHCWLWPGVSLFSVKQRGMPAMSTPQESREHPGCSQREPVRSTAHSLVCWLPLGNLAVPVRISSKRL